MASPAKRNKLLVLFAALAILVSCALGAAAIVGWLPAGNGIPADVMVPIDTEHSLLKRMEHESDWLYPPLDANR